MLACLSLNAQQALWGASQFSSPEVNPDNTVTVRFKAPKAVKVQVTGDSKPSRTAQKIVIAEKGGAVQNELHPLFASWYSYVLERSLRYWVFPNGEF